MVRTIAWSASSSSNDPAPADKEICVRELINAAGRQKESPGIDMKVGKMTKEMLLADKPDFVFPKKQIYANGQLIMANMWPES